MAQPSWKERFTRAKTVGHFTRQDQWDASGWPSCAVGEGLPGLTYQDALGLPDQLQELGTEFALAVFANKIALAEKAYREIHKYLKETSSTQRRFMVRS